MNRTRILLIIFFCIALSVRLYQLGSTPNSLTWDEAALGYNTYSILTTGADEYSIRFPLVLRSYDDYKPALYAYLSLPFIRIFGLTVTAIRLLSAISGAFLVFSVFLLARNILHSRQTALIAAGLVVFSPLLLHFSRMAIETNLSLTLFVTGTALVLNPPPNFSSKTYILGLFLLLLSANAYHSARYLVPWVVFYSWMVPFDRPLIRRKLMYLIPFGILYLPIVYFILDSRYNTRFIQTSLFTNIGITFAYISKLSTTPAPFAAVSRIYFLAMDFGGRYFSYFNPFNLFIKASGHELYFLDTHGVYNSIELPFWIIGVFQLLRHPRRFGPIILLWFLAPLPASVTIDWFSAHRSNLLWPFLLLLTAVGVHHFLNWSSRFKPYLIAIFVCLWIFQVGRVVESVLAYQPYAHYGAYQYGFAQTIPFVNDVKDQYSQVIIDSPHAQPHMFVLFFAKYPPSLYQQETIWRQTDYTKRTNLNFGPYHFRKIYWPSDRSLKNTLFMGDVFSLPDDQIRSTPNLKLVKDFYTPDGNISFRVVATSP